MIYNSIKHKGLFKIFKKVRQKVLNILKEKNYGKFYLFAAYDLNFNTRHGHHIDRKDLPIIRYYKKEEYVSNYYIDRFLTKDFD